VSLTCQACDARRCLTPQTVLVDLVPSDGGE